MTELFLTILIISAWCNGLWIATSDGYVFEKFRKYLDRIFIKDVNGIEVTSWIYKPIIGCINCMASVHGCFIYFVLHGFGVYALWELPIVIMCCVWLNGVFFRLDS